MVTNIRRLLSRCLAEWYRKSATVLSASTPTTRRTPTQAGNEEIQVSSRLGLNNRIPSHMSEAVGLILHPTDSPWDDVRGEVVTSASDIRTLTNLLVDCNLQLIYTDGSYIPAKKTAGSAWAHFRHSPGQQGAQVSNFVSEDYGPVVAEDRLDLTIFGGREVIVSSLTNQSAEIMGMIRALLYVARSDTIMGQHQILLRYDSEVAKLPITGPSIPSLNDSLHRLAASGQHLLHYINARRRHAAELRNNGTAALSNLAAFQIHFQHVFAHQDLDLGNNWVDMRAGEGARGFSPDQPNTANNRSVEDKLRCYVPGFSAAPVGPDTAISPIDEGEATTEARSTSNTRENG